MYVTADTPNDLFKVEEGSVSYYLSKPLALQQKITLENLALLVEAHKYKHRVFAEMQATKSRKKLQLLAAKVEEIEFYLQELWGFEKNATMHEWYRVPKCSCAKLDNADFRGTPYRSINSECLVHGSKV